MVGLFVSLDGFSSIHVRVEGGGRSAEVERVAQSAARVTGTNVVVECMDTATLEVRFAVGRHWAELRAVLGVGDVLADEATSQVVVDVAPGATSPDVVLALATRLSSSERVSVRVDQADTRHVVNH